MTTHAAIRTLLAGIFAVAIALPSGTAQAAFPGEVLSAQKITEGAGGFTGTLASADIFGTALANIGNFDGDGNTDLAVGAWNTDSGCCSEGAVYVLRLDADGTVVGHFVLSDATPVLTATIGSFDNFGTSVAPLGDFDGNGVLDLVVGGKGDAGLGGGFGQGAVWLVELEANGAVAAVHQIGDGLGGFTGILDNADEFGSSVANLGDLDGNGVVDLAVGAPQDDDGGTNRGAVWILFLEADGTVGAHTKISDTGGGFGGGLGDFDEFGTAVAALGDLDEDGLIELAVGAPGDGAGAVWILSLDDDGSVQASTRIAPDAGGFVGPLAAGDGFGRSVAAADIDGDRVVDLAVGAPGDDDGGVDPLGRQGAVWMLFLEPDGSVKSERKLSATSADFAGMLDDGDEFGDALAFLGDLDGDAVVDLAVGAHQDDQSGANEGAVWNLFLNAARWVDLGSGLAGTVGIPVQDGFGSLVGDEAVTIDLDGALANTTAFLLVGFAELSAPFEGGILVPDPSPPALILAFGTGAGGGYDIAATWPTGVPDGFTFWIQTWVEDGGAPFGYAGSNALRAQTP